MRPLDLGRTLEVESRAKPAARASEDDDAAGVVGRELAEHSGECRHRCGVERVEALGSVERHDPDPALGSLDS